MHKRLFPLYPMLFACYPVLMLYSKNTRNAPASDVVRPLVVSLGFAAVVLLVTHLVLRNRAKTGICASLFIAMFLSYGHLLKGFTKLPRKLGVDWRPVLEPLPALVVWIVLLAICLALIIRSKSKLNQAVRFLTVWSVLLTMMALFRVVAALTSGGPGSGSDMSGWERWIDQQRVEARSFQQIPGRPKPDIYYLIIDMYGSNDVLSRVYGYDNTPFINSLARRGFYVARHSRCNYACTQFSLPSSLNFDYIDNLKRMSNEPSVEYSRKTISNSRIARILQIKGYKYVFLISSWGISNECPYADILPNNGAVPYTELERSIVEGSVLNLLSAANADVNLRNQTSWQFDQLEQVPKIKGPTFTFTHIVCPHDPWVFDHNGAMPAQTITESPAATRLAYIEQVRYVNKRLLRVIDRILADSPTPPIIVIQADHGPLDPTRLARWLGSGDITDPDGKVRIPHWSRAGILNAYYLPGDAKSVLYDTITPVNTWRIVLDRYFGARFPLLKDVTYVPTTGWVGRGKVFQIKDFRRYP